MLTGQAKKDYQRDYMKTKRVRPAVLDPDVRPAVLDPKPASFGLADCECMHCQSARANKSKNTIVHDDRPLGLREVRVDYVGVAS